MSTNGQFIAAGDQEKNVVKLWNITSSNQYATLQVFQGIFELYFVLTLLAPIFAYKFSQLISIHFP